METKKGMDNKKLTKILFISGFGLLILFIIVRLAFKSHSERITDMPTAPELSYAPKKMEEKTKMQQFEQRRLDRQRKEMGYEENNYVVPDFNDLTRKSDSIKAGSEASIVDEQRTAGNSSYSRQNNNERNNTVQQNPSRSRQAPKPSTNEKEQSTQSNQQGGLKFHSNYFDSKKEETESSVKVQPKSETVPITTPRNPFGTISSESKSAIQKEGTNSNFNCKAEIYGDQKIENGGIVMIRSTEGFGWGSVTVPRNSILYGQAVFEGNRVQVKINRVKTQSGEYSVNFAVWDNDRLEGIYYKAPIDETVDNAKQDVNAPQVPGTYGAVLSTLTQTVVKSGKDLMKKKQTLNLEDGYKLFIVPAKQN